MTFDEAMKAVKDGKAVRHDGMSRGWKIVNVPLSGGRDFFACHNPHTGSNYQFTANDDDKAADWSIVEGWGTYA